MDQISDIERLPKPGDGLASGELDADDLAGLDEELSDDRMQLAIGAMRTVMPTFCWHTDPPHVEDYIFM